MKSLPVAARRTDAWLKGWRSQRGAAGIREMIALMAVAVTILAAAVMILEVAGFDVAAWLQDQFGSPG